MLSGEDTVIKLGTQAMISVYLHPDDYETLKTHADLCYGNKKMAHVVRIALKEHFAKIGLPFGIEPGTMKFEEE